MAPKGESGGNRPAMSMANREPGKGNRRVAHADLQVARQYAGRGWAILPVDANKRPLTAHGHRDASQQVGSWPEGALCAVATGWRSGADVLDVDVRQHGANGFQTLQDLGLELPPTLAVSTPRGGAHYWFKHIEGSRSRRLCVGVEWFRRAGLA
jgi:hypothetical protein